MPARKATPQELARYVRNFVTEEKSSGKTWAAIGKSLGIGHSRVIQIANPKKYGDVRVGHEVLSALADRLHKGSLDKLNDAAVAWAEEHPEVGAEASEARYPARERAIRALIGLGRDEVAVREAADEVAVALDSDTDLDPEWWLDRIRLQMTARKRPGPRLGQRELTEDDDPAPPRKAAGKAPTLDAGKISDSALQRALRDAATLDSEEEEEDWGEDERPSGKLKRASKPHQ